MPRWIYLRPVLTGTRGAVDGCSRGKTWSEGEEENEAEPPRRDDGVGCM